MTDKALTLVKSEWLDDWYRIEFAEHDGREWLEPTSYGASFMRSARPSDAEIEGTADEMLGIAAAIEARTGFHARRCSVGFVADHFVMDSPRNSTRPAIVSVSVADALAREIREKLNAAPPLHDPTTDHLISGAITGAAGGSNG